MDFAVLTRTIVVLSLTCLSGSCLQRTIADESTSVVFGRSEPEIDRVRELGRLAWAMLDAIEREHVLAPAREGVIQTATQVLTTGFTDGPELDVATAKFAGCQNADAFAEVLWQYWEKGHRSVKPLHQVPDELTKELGNRLGSMALIPAKQHAVEQQLLGNRYVGLGVGLSTRPDNQVLQFHQIVPGGPADRSGLKAGTSIYEIDGRSTVGVPVETVIDWIRGPVGTEITLQVTGHYSSDRRTMTLKRGFVRFDSVVDKGGVPLSRGTLQGIGAEPIGWIKINTVTGSTLNELREADVKARVTGIRVMIFDLRSHSRSDNLHQVKLAADSLLDGGTLWNQTDRRTKPFAEVADRECLFRGIPLVLVVDRNSGPGQSAIAAALQDAGRAKIVGEASGFTGMFMNMVPLFDSPFFLSMNTTQLTRARSDRHWPLQPDVPVAVQNEQAVQFQPNGRVSTVSTTFTPGRSPTAHEAQIALSLKMPASALSPANQLPKTRSVIGKISESAGKARRQAIALVDPTALVPIPSAEEMAIQIARELLNALPKD